MGMAGAGGGNGTVASVAGAVRKAWRGRWTGGEGGDRTAARFRRRETTRRSGAPRAVARQGWAAARLHCTFRECVFGRQRQSGTSEP